MTSHVYSPKVYKLRFYGQNKLTRLELNVESLTLSCMLQNGQRLCMKGIMSNVQQIVKTLSKWRKLIWNDLYETVRDDFSWIMDSSCAVFMECWPWFLTCKRKRYQETYHSSRIHKSLHMWACELKQTVFNLILKQKP